MSDLNDVVNQLAALRGVLTQLNPQAPAAWAPAMTVPPAPMAPVMPAPAAMNPAALQALHAILAQPDPTPGPTAVVDDELRKEVRNVAAQVQALATAMQMMANQMGALVMTTKTRLETLAAASMAHAARKADEPPKEPLVSPPPAPTA